MAPITFSGITLLLIIRIAILDFIKNISPHYTQFLKKDKKVAIVQWSLSSDKINIIYRSQCFLPTKFRLHQFYQISDSRALIQTTHNCFTVVYHGNNARPKDILYQVLKSYISALHIVHFKLIKHKYFFVSLGKLTFSTNLKISIPIKKSTCL